MISTLIGRKQNMSSAFTKLGHRVPVTYIVAEPNVILASTDERVTLGMGQKKKPKKTESQFVKTAGFAPRIVKEVKLQTPQENQTIQKLNPGDKVNVSIFESGDLVKVSGTTKGRGFAGVVKRHGFHGGPKTHGQSDRHRAPGSIGAGTTPGRVYKGKKMAGHMGATKLTITNLEVIEVDKAKDTIVIKGVVPGHKNGFVVVEKTGKVKGYTPPPPPNEEKQEEKQEKAEETATTKNAENKSDDSENTTMENESEKNEGEQNAG